MLTFDDSPTDNVTHYDMYSLVSYDTDSASIKCEEDPASVQLMSSKLSNADSSNYSPLWTSVVAVGQDSSASENMQSKTALAQSTVCGGSVDEKTFPDGMQVVGSYIVASTTTPGTCTGEGKFSGSGSSEATISTCLSSTMCDDTNVNTSWE